MSSGPPPSGSQEPHKRDYDDGSREVEGRSFLRGDDSRLDVRRDDGPRDAVGRGESRDYDDGSREVEGRSFLRGDDSRLDVLRDGRRDDGPRDAVGRGERRPDRSRSRSLPRIRPSPPPLTAPPPAPTQGPEPAVPEPAIVPCDPYHGTLARAVAEPVPRDLLAAVAAQVAFYIQAGVEASSEMAVMAYHHGLWIYPITQLFKVQLSLDSHDRSSSGALRPDAVFFKNNALCGKLEAKASSGQIVHAARELTEKLRSDVDALFPARQDTIPGFAVSGTIASVYAISRQRRAVFLSEHRLLTARDRLNFLGVALQVGRWMAAVTGPSSEYHLPHGVKTSTGNGHEVFLDVHGLRKTHRGGLANIDLIKKVYSAEGARNVERGQVVSNRVLLITSVGVPVSIAIDRGLSRGNVREQVRQGLDQLHALGVAHCDVRLPNVFALDGTVFLGDLEYCTPVDAPPPAARRREGINTARELDEAQYAELCAELP